MFSVFSREKSFESSGCVLIPLTSSTRFVISSVTCFNLLSVVVSGLLMSSLSFNNCLDTAALFTALTIDSWLINTYNLLFTPSEKLIFESKKVFKQIFGISIVL